MFLGEIWTSFSRKLSFILKEILKGSNIIGGELVWPKSGFFTQGSSFFVFLFCSSSVVFQAASENSKILKKLLRLTEEEKIMAFLLNKKLHIVSFIWINLFFLVFLGLCFSNVQSIKKRIFRKIRQLNKL